MVQKKGKKGKKVAAAPLAVKKPEAKRVVNPLFELMDKYRPETKQAKKERLRERAAARAEGKEDAPTKRAAVVRHGVNTVTTLTRKERLRERAAARAAGKEDA